MRKIFVVFIFAALMFSGCERIKNSLGLSPANAEIPANPKIPENSNKSESPPPPPSQEELINQSNKSYDPPESDLGDPNNARRSRTIFFTTTATTLAAWVVVGVWYTEVPAVLDVSVLAIAVIGIPATIGTGIHAYKATVSESNKGNPSEK